MKSRQRRECESLAGLYILMAAVGLVAGVLWLWTRERGLAGLALGCLPAGLVGAVSAGWVARRTA